MTGELILVSFVAITNDFVDTREAHRQRERERHTQGRMGGSLMRVNVLIKR